MQGIWLSTARSRHQQVSCVFSGIYYRGYDPFDNSLTRTFSAITKYCSVVHNRPLGVYGNDPPIRVHLTRLRNLLSSLLRIIAKQILLSFSQESLMIFSRQDELRAT